MKLLKILNGLGILKITGETELEITGIAYDSRKVKQGYLFVCIEGATTDGHNYIPMAIENGARALLVQREENVPAGVTCVKVDNTRYALAFVADAFFEHPSGKLKLAGITGTKGKTTTTFMIKSILDKSRKVGLIGTLGTRIGEEVLYSERTTPESYDLQSLLSEMVDKEVASAVMEVSSQGLALHRVSCCDYEVGVFTNLSKDHISENEHASMEEYLEAKLKLFSMCKKAIINIDNQYSQKVLASTKCEVLTVSIDKEADITAKNIVMKASSVNFTAVTPWFTEEITINVPGKFSIYNALCAIGVSGLFGATVADIKEGLAKVSVPGRVEKVETGKDFTVLIDYAHTPDSLENVLTTVKNFTPGRLISLFGCGGDRDRTKRPIMGEISGNIADLTIITSDNPRTEEPIEILKQIEEGMKKTNGKYTCIVDRREAIKYALEIANKDDVIVLAGKGHETYQTFKDKTIHFDEREIVAGLLQK